MVANLFLHKDAFAYNGTDTEDQVKDKLRSFVDDMRDIVYVHNGENVFYVSTDFLDCEIFSGISLIESLTEFLDGDRQGIMYSILANTSEQHNYSMEDLKRKAQYRPDEEEVNSLVLLNCPTKMKDSSYYIQFDNYEIVYDTSSWITLRRQILGNHPVAPEVFVKECRKYFNNLVFHEACIESLQDNNYQYLNYIPRKIIFYLSCLNDCFALVREEHKTLDPNANSILSDFSGRCGLDEPGSIERNPAKKPFLTFKFKRTGTYGEEHEVKEMLCEPHLKISQPDSNCRLDVNDKTFHPRIYFHFGEETVENGRILIASIGKHL